MELQQRIGHFYAIREGWNRLIVLAGWGIWSPGARPGELIGT